MNQLMNQVIPKIIRFLIAYRLLQVVIYRYWHNQYIQFIAAFGTSIIAKQEPNLSQYVACKKGASGGLYSLMENPSLCYGFTEGNIKSTVSVDNVTLASLDTSISVYHSSLDDLTNSPLGPGWTHSFNQQVVTNTDGTITYIMPCGKRVQYYDDNDDDVLESEPHYGDYSVITDTGTGYILTKSDLTEYSFDSAGKLTLIQDRDGNQYILTYTDGKLTTFTDPYSRETDIQYNGDYISSITDPKDQVTNFYYTGNRLTSITKGGGEWAYQFTYKAGTQLISSKTNPNGKTTQYEYNDRGKLTKITDPDSKETNITYDELHSKTTITDRTGQTRDIGYDLLRDLALDKKDALGHTTKFTIDENRNILSKTKPNGATTTYTYDSSGNVLTMTDALSCTTTYQYEDPDNPYLPTRIIDPLNITTYFEYDDNGNRTHVTDPLGRIYEYQYDNANRLKKAIYPLISGEAQAHSETWTYGDYGNLKTYTDAKGTVVTYIYDDLQRLVQEQYSTGEVILRTYDDAGNLEQIYFDDNSVKITYNYNSLNQLEGAEWYLNGTLWKTISYTYDNAGNRDTMTGPEGVLVDYQYDNNNRIENIIRNETGGPINYAAYQYDIAGRLKQMTRANGAYTSYNYDNKGRLNELRTKKNDDTPIAGFVYGYDKVDNRTSVYMEHQNIQVEYQYNNLYWLKGEVWLGGQNGEPWTNQYVNIKGGNESLPSNEVSAIPGKLGISYYAFYDYDKNGNRLYKHTNTGGASYQYDQENRLTAETSYASVDPLRNLIQLTPEADSVETGYSKAVISDGETEDSIDPNYCWKSLDTAGEHWAELSWAEAKPINQVKVYKPTDIGEVQRFKIQWDDEGAWDDLPVTYIEDGEPSDTDPGWYKSAKHEVTFFCTTVSTDKIRYLQADGGGSASSPNVAFLNELEPYTVTYQPAIAYGYDNNGNMISRGDETFIYDYANRLNSYNNGTNIWQYKYTPTGERLAKVSPDSSEEWYFYDGPDVIADYNLVNPSTYELVNSYVNGLGIDSKLAKITPDAQPIAHYYVNDGLGSVHQMIDASQQVVNSYLTTAWGESIQATEGTSNRYGFTQRENDTESGLMCYRARSYDPRLGRFIQKDPVFNNIPEEHYIYASNSPLNYFDPTGRTNNLFVQPDGLNIVMNIVFYYNDKTWLKKGGFVITHLQWKSKIKSVWNKMVKNLEAISDDGKKKSIKFDLISSIVPDPKGEKFKVRANYPIYHHIRAIPETGVSQVGGKGETAEKYQRNQLSCFKGWWYSHFVHSYIYGEKRRKKEKEGVEAVAHEAGHLLGLPDTYTKGLLGPGGPSRPFVYDPRKKRPVKTPEEWYYTIMGAQMQEGLYPQMAEYVINWIVNQGKSYRVIKKQGADGKPQIEVKQLKNHWWSVREKNKPEKDPNNK